MGGRIRHKTKKTLLLLALATGVQSTTVSVWSAASSHDDTADGILRQLNTQAQQAYASHHFDVAEARYKEAQKLAAAKPLLEIVLWSNLGAVLREQHKYDEADSAFKQALQIAGKNNALNKPESQTAMQQYAVLLRKMHRADEAEAWDMRAAAAAAAAAASGVVSVVPGEQGASFNSGSSESNAGLTQEDVPKPDTGNSTYEYDKTSIEQLRSLVDRTPNRPEPLAWLAHKYAEKNDWQQAINTLQILFLRFPTEVKKEQPMLAMCLYKNGQYEEAASAINKAIDFDPNKSIYYLQLHDYQRAAGNLHAALDAEKAFLDKFPGDPNYEMILQDYQYALNDLKTREEKPPANTALQPGDTRYWAPNNFPLKVYIHNRYDDSFRFPPSSTQMSEDTPVTVIQKACDMWTRSSLNRVTFVLTDREDDAQIEVFFTDSPDGLEAAYAQGVTEPPRKGEMKARVRLLTMQGSSGQPIDRASFLETVLHELGHALGLEHSSDPHDIMFPSVHQKPLASLSDNDAQRMQMLYSQ